VAVAVASEPRTQLQDRRKTAGVTTRRPGGVEIDHRRQHGLADGGERVTDLVAHGDPFGTMQAGQPQERDLALQGDLREPISRLRPVRALAIGQETCDREFSLDHAPPADLGRVGGEHGHDVQAVDRRLGMALDHLSQGQRALLRLRAAPPASGVLGDVAQKRVTGEGPGECRRFRRR
jgi:hypothetical protein